MLSYVDIALLKADAEPILTRWSVHEREYWLIAGAVEPDTHLEDHPIFGQLFTTHQEPGRTLARLVRIVNFAVCAHWNDRPSEVPHDAFMLLMDRIPVKYRPEFFRTLCQACRQFALDKSDAERRWAEYKNTRGLWEMMEYLDPDESAYRWRSLRETKRQRRRELLGR